MTRLMSAPRNHAGTGTASICQGPIVKKIKKDVEMMGGAINNWFILYIFCIDASVTPAGREQSVRLILKSAIRSPVKTVDIVRSQSRTCLTSFQRMVKK